MSNGSVGLENVESNGSKCTVALHEWPVLGGPKRPELFGENVDNHANKWISKEKESQCHHECSAQDCKLVLPSRNQTLECDGIQIMSPWLALQQLGPHLFFNGRRKEYKLVKQSFEQKKICHQLSHASLFPAGKTRYLWRCVKSGLLN